jgi:hypothetical protein
VGVGSGVLEAVSLGVMVGVSLGVDVGVGKGVNVSVAVGGAKVGDAVTGDGVAGTVTDGGSVTGIVGLGAGSVAVAEAVGVAGPGALRMAMNPAQ